MATEQGASLKRSHETDEDSDCAVVEQNSSFKKRTVSRKQTFKPDYATTWPCLTPSKLGPSMVRCTICGIDFTCSHGGRNECSRHVSSNGHKRREFSVSSTAKITNMFQNKAASSASAFQQSVTKSDIQFCQVIADNNMSFR